MKFPVSRSRTVRGRAGFSLVEVTLAVGIMAFSLVGILGVLPLAMNSGRQSFNQARATAVANSLFATIRNQPFSEIHYLDSQFAADGSPTSGGDQPLNLNTLGATDTQLPGAKFYARFLDTPTDASQGNTLGDVRRLCLTSTLPMTSDGQPYRGEFYLVQLYFNNAPEGTIVAADAASRIGQANRITAVVSATSVGEESRRVLPDPSKPSTTPSPLRDPYRFVTTVANRLN